MDTQIVIHDLHASFGIALYTENGMMRYDVLEDKSQWYLGLEEAVSSHNYASQLGYLSSELSTPTVITCANSTLRPSPNFHHSSYFGSPFRIRLHP